MEYYCAEFEGKVHRKKVPIFKVLFRCLGSKRQLLRWNITRVGELNLIVCYGSPGRETSRWSIVEAGVVADGV